MALIFCLLLSIAAFAQEANSTERSFANYQQRTVQEKVFVHTDKNFYIAGEIAWFKLYNVNASTNKPLALSKVAYVDVLDSANKPVLKTKIGLTNGEGDGSLYLPLSLNSGNYRLRAYTNWMKNFSPDYFFEKNITIVNIERNPGTLSEHSSKNFHMSFFPEGGNLVYNIEGKVAFIASDDHGHAINFTASLMDDTDTVLQFHPLHNGIGSFSFTPLPGHSYKALIRPDSGQAFLQALPAVYEDGYVLHLIDSSGQLRVLVRAHMPDQAQTFLFIHTRGIKKAFLAGAFKNNVAVFDIDKNILDDGISTLTVFNSHRQPVCERLYFKRPSTPLQLSSKTDQTVYPTRSKINVDISVENSFFKNDTASLSMSIYRDDSLQNDEASIESYLLLASDLNGYVEDPDYYFRSAAPQTNEALDNLMLTYGWRRFKWEDILNNVKPFFEFPPEYNGPIVSGTVMNSGIGKPAAGVELYAGIPGYPKVFCSSVSDSKGAVHFEMKNFYGSSQLVFQPHSDTNSNYTFIPDDAFTKMFSSKPFPLFKLPANAESLLHQSVSMQVQTIFSGNELKHFNIAGTDSSSFFKSVNATYLLDNYTRYTTLEEVLREYVVLTDVRKREGKFHISLYDFSYRDMFKTDPLILLDGVPVFDIDKFMEIDPLKLYKLEVINRRYFLGNSVFTGALSWTSYKRNMADYEPANATIIDYDGLQAQREFYSPVYENDEQRLSHMPDFRNVLLWSPHITIAPGQSKEINFYSSDIPGKYIIVIQGITKNGRCGKSAFSFEVKKKITD